MMKFKSDEKFKKTIQGFMDYFHAACHDYQVGYVRGRISEMLKMNDAEIGSFFQNFVKNGFAITDVDERVAKSLEEVGKITSEKHEGAHDDCSKDGKHPKYFSVPKMMKFKKDKRFKKTIQGFMDYFHHACHEYQVGYVKGRVSELILLSPAEFGSFLKRFSKTGFNADEIDERVAKSVEQVMIITAAK
jgi:hypothetical protein